MSRFGSPERKAALDKIMEGYDSESVVTEWYPLRSDEANCDGGGTTDCKPNYEYKSLPDIRTMFDSLFFKLQGCADVNATAGGLDTEADVVESTISAPGSVFLVWQCRSGRHSYLMATDTFVFDGVIIRKQNSVHSVQIPTAGVGRASSQSRWPPLSLNQQISAQDYKPETVQAAWDNHFQAFGNGANGIVDEDKKDALDQIMKDYTDDSAVHLATVPEGSTVLPEFVEHKGLVAIRNMFDGLFKDLPDVCNLAAPLQQVTGDTDSAAKQVFLVWRIPASGYKYATDTFVFDNEFRISKQNILVERAAKDTQGCNSVVV